MRRELAIAIVLPGLISCGTLLEPDDIAGEFALQAVPVVLQLGTARLEIIADTIRVSTDGSAVRFVTESFQSEAGTYVSSRIEQYRYSIRRGTVEFAYACPPNAMMLCVPPPHFWGTPTSNGLSLRSAIDPQVRLQYERVRAP